MKKIGTFLSNFTELHIERLNSNNLKDADLIYFGVWHNFVNNFNSTISNYSGGHLFISKAKIEQSIKKFFNIKFKSHKSIQGIKFNGKGYVFDGASGDPVDYVKVINVYDMGSSTFEVYGELYADPYSWVEAVIKKITENKKSRYILISLSVKN
ncbi:hypothetical protein DCC85_01095 [Paenibacillus sp. CAA11]|uniref:hypothetical protein n=1 Tax=Paenibacillus sp. CAA11 TaxID=1532905 RepID=UPI000D36A216|nr:hypothetical protein [Paenibacillus sp. CAA11]AWB42960.1 hypothetical protein DCC85_01095 [Paenibacillus sp. CAA11]